MLGTRLTSDCLIIFANEEFVKKCVCAVLLINSLNVVGVGQAFVEFVNEETAARAMQLHREPMGSVCCFAKKNHYSHAVHAWYCLFVS